MADWYVEQDMETKEYINWDAVRKKFEWLDWRYALQGAFSFPLDEIIEKAKQEQERLRAYEED